jgi:hypothetical protein
VRSTPEAREMRGSLGKWESLRDSGRFVSPVIEDHVVGVG